MKRSKKSVVYFILLLVLITAFLFGFYGKIIISPNSYLFNSQGDGIKSYYTYAYYIQDNKSFINFEGMNYPYGDNFTYTDCHPVLSFLLKLLHPVFPGLSTYSIGILNLWMILSLGLTVFVLYFLFRELKVSHLLSALGAMGIMALSPQIFRITGHYALSYSFFIPLTIYLLVLYEKGLKRKKISIFIAFSILFYFTIHAYLGMVAATMVLAYMVINILAELIRQRKITVKKQLILFLSAVLPVLAYYVFVKITDTHTGRTTNPWGISEYHAELGSIFLPVISPLDKIKNALFPGVLQPWEGWSYIGLITTLVLVLFLLFSIVSSIKTKSVSLNKNWVENITLRQLFVASIFILIFSLYVPFRWHGFERMINYFDFIKQFRSIGRFAWVFYFVSTILIICTAEKWFQWLIRKKMRIPAYILIMAIPLSLFGEGFYHHAYVSKGVIQSPNLFDNKQLPETLRKDIESVNIYHYQAILPFPFFCIGSENYGKTADEKIYKYTFLFSYYTNLPIIGGSMSRSSIPETKNIMQLMGSNFYKKNIRNDLPNDKAFLIVCLNGFTDNTEAGYLEKAALLVHRDEYSLYEINPAAFFENTATNEIEKFNSEKNKLLEKDGFLVSDTSLYFKFIDFENENPVISFEGSNGCYSGLQKDYNILFSIEKGKLPLNKKFTARFWMYNEGKNYGQDCLSGMFFFQRKIGDQLEWLQPFAHATNSHEINGNWSMVEISFENTDANASYELVLKGSDIAEKTIYIDGLLFYDNDLTIYKVYDFRNRTTLYHNNHWIDFPESSR
ncbi:MAG TPA: hypothetical protein PKI01_05455 [Bacteroidales bacterium]|nr:hypothetical protein [Bacteroidales bacterium]